MSDIEELIKLEPYKSCYEYGEMQGRADAERDFQNSDYWNDYLVKVIADAKADAIDEMVLKLETNMPNKLDGKERYGYTVALSILLEQLKEQENSD